MYDCVVVLCLAVSVISEYLTCGTLQSCIVDKTTNYVVAVISDDVNDEYSTGDTHDSLTRDSRMSPMRRRSRNEWRRLRGQGDVERTLLLLSYKSTVVNGIILW